MKKLAQEVYFYTKENCLLCDEALMHLKTLQHLHNFKLVTRDIYTKEQWLEAYQLTIPVIEVKGQKIYGNEMSLTNIERFLSHHL